MVEPWVGGRVTLQGLKAAPAMNGRTGAVQSFNTDKGRYAVLLDQSDGEGTSSAAQGLFKAENLRIADSDSSLEGWVPRAAQVTGAEATGADATGASFFFRDAFAEEPLEALSRAGAAAAARPLADALANGCSDGADSPRLLLRPLTRAALVNAPVAALAPWLDALVCAGAVAEVRQASPPSGPSPSGSEPPSSSSRLNPAVAVAWAAAEPFLLSAPAHALDLAAGSSSGAGRSSSSSGGGGGPCGYQFKRGDICWNCRTCQADNTCVLCDACFKASDHAGHQVLFHQAGVGGCCDCGDAEAWAPAGCCPRHRPAAASAAPPTVTAADTGDGAVAATGDDGIVEGLPPALASAAAAVCLEAAWFLVAGAHGTVAGFGAPSDPGGPLAGALATEATRGSGDSGSGDSGSGDRGSGDTTSSSDSGDSGSRGAARSGWLGSALGALRGSGRQEPGRTAAGADGGTSSSSRSRSMGGGRARFSVRVHNDDVHTYDHVIRALQAIGLTSAEARAATATVDKRGSAVVAQRLGAAAAARCVASLHAAGLLACALQTSPGGGGSDGSDDSDAEGGGGQVAVGGQLAVEARVEACVAWLNAFAARGKPFRAVVAAALVQPLPRPGAADGGRSVAGPPPPRWQVLARLGAASVTERSESEGPERPREVAVLDTWQPARGSGADQADDEEDPREVEKLAPGNDAAAGRAGWVTRLQAPSSPLLLLLLADPFLAPPQARSQLGQLYMRLLPDAAFKGPLAAALAAARPHLSLLFARGVRATLELERE
jgi:ATP-dependent Clp protease adapter protein ClpS